MFEGRDDETVDDKTVEDDNNISFKDKSLNKLFKGQRELYKYYNIKSCPMNNRPNPFHPYPL